MLLYIFAQSKVQNFLIVMYYTIYHWITFIQMILFGAYICDDGA